MDVILNRAEKSDINTIGEMQVKAFSGLLKKYQNYDISPATESFEKVIRKSEQPWTTYYFIEVNGKKVGAVRIIDKKDGSRKRISPIWIMSEYRDNGYAQTAMMEIEKLYGSDYWCLDTILQEKENLYLFEKLGYHQTGKVEYIKDGMDIEFYEKN
ncbi:MAG TPA: GNAT family N-acetyltransferase [Oscillospiraceae bacterium]|nr:GNAT family N-acetyltransferase [Oscillospiraceae bacterium]